MGASCFSLFKTSNTCLFSADCGVVSCSCQVLPILQSCMHFNQQNFITKSPYHSTCLHSNGNKWLLFCSSQRQKPFYKLSFFVLVGKKTKLKKKEDPAGDGEVADLLSRLNLQSSHEVFPSHNPKYDFRSDCQALPNPNSKSQAPFVPVSFSAEVLPWQNSPSPLLVTPSQNVQNEGNSGSALGSQTELTGSSMDSYASSAIADLQLSDIDWKGTSFSISPAHVNDSCCSDSARRACSNSTGQRGPLHCKTADILPLFSNSVQCNQDPHSSVDCCVSGSNLPGGQNSLSSNGQVILKLSALELSSNNPKVSPISPLPMTGQSKGTSRPEGEFSKVLAQRNASLQRTEAVLPKKYPGEFSLENNTKLPKQPVCASQKPTGSSASRSVGLCIETIEPAYSGNEPGMSFFPKPMGDLDNCQTREDFAQMSVKNALKSVCQRDYSSSEASDEENVQGRRKASRGPQWQKKSSLVQLKDECYVKRSDRKLEFEIKRKGKVSVTDFLVEEHPKPVSVVHVHSSLSPIEVSRPHLRDSGSGAEVWVDSPLPLSERLKLRL